MITPAMLGAVQVPGFLVQHRYLLLFVAALLEGPLATILAAGLVAQGVLGLAPVYATVVLGDLAGDLLCYAVGRWCLARLSWPGRGALRRRAAALCDYLRERPGRVLLVGKWTHSAGFAVLLAAGAARVRPLVYMAYNLLGTLPKSALLMLLGYGLGRATDHLHGALRLAGLAGLALALLLLAGLALRLRAPAGDPAR